MPLIFSVNITTVVRLCFGYNFAFFHKRFESPDVNVAVLDRVDFPSASGTTSPTTTVTNMIDQ
ncbi:hypothetical protein HanPSC8_Chr04g0181681 [Helianthus annuus]|nr:hypothetical protein HanPSC8_Chr04g0181681 [Helianthus annuus]